MERFDEARFRLKVDAALHRVRTILENNRTPQFAANVPHEYEDKYLLIEFLTTNTISSVLTALEAMGLTEKALAQMQDWSKKRSVNLRLKAEEKCKFLRKAVREVQSDTKHVSEFFLVFLNY